MSELIKIEILDVSRFFTELAESQDFLSKQFRATFDIENLLRANTALTPTLKLRSCLMETIYPQEKIVLRGYFNDVSTVTKLLESHGFLYEKPVIDKTEEERTVFIQAGFDPRPFQK